MKTFEDAILRTSISDDTNKFGLHECPFKLNFVLFVFACKVSSQYTTVNTDYLNTNIFILRFVSLRGSVVYLIS